MAWTTEGKKSSPANGTVLADTGQLSAGTYSFKFLATSTVVVGNLLLQLRNSGNSSTVMEQTIATPPGQSLTIDIGGLAVGTDERVRVVTDGTSLGALQASLFYQ